MGWKDAPLAEPQGSGQAPQPAWMNAPLIGQESTASQLPMNGIPGNLDVPMPNNSPDVTPEKTNPFLEGLKETGRVLDTGIKQGLRGPMEANNFLQGLIGMPQIPHEQWLQDALKSVTPLENKPETPLGQSAANVLGDVTSSAILPGGTVAQRVVQGLGGGLGVEGAKAAGVTDPKYLAAAALLGGAGGLGTKVALQSPLAAGARYIGVPAPDIPSARTVALSQEALRGTTPESLMLAQDAQKEALKQGVHLTLGDALPTANNTQMVEKVLANTPEGAPLAAQLRAQPQEVANAANSFQQTLPGNVKGQQEIANQGQRAATQAYQAIKNARSDAVRPDYQAAGSFDASHVFSAAGTLKDLAKQYPNVDAGNLISDLASRMFTSTTRDINGVSTQVLKPITDVNKLNRVLREAKSDLGKPNISGKAYSAETSGIVNDAIQSVRNDLATANPAFANANAKYAELSGPVNAAKQGPLGQVAGRAGYDPSNPASRSALYSVFDRGTVSGGRSEVLTLQKDMAKAGDSGNQAFADAGASWFADGLDKALKNSGGTVTPNVASRIESQFFGTDAGIQRTKDVLAGIAQAQGRDPKELVDGGISLMKTIQRVASSSPGPVGTTTSDVQAAMAAPVATLGRLSLAEPLRIPTQMYSNFVGKNARTTVAKLLQTPDGIEQLKKFAQVKPGSPAAIKALIALNATLTPQEEK